LGSGIKGLVSSIFLLLFSVLPVMIPWDCHFIPLSFTRSVLSQFLYIFSLSSSSPSSHNSSTDDPHTKALLLLQAHIARLPLPISDYITDTKTTLDNFLRVLQALVDVAAEAGRLRAALAAMALAQAVTQARWHDDDPLTVLPGVTEKEAARLKKAGYGNLKGLLRALDGGGAAAAAAKAAVQGAVGGGEAGRLVLATAARLPVVELGCRIQGGEVGSAAGADADINARSSLSFSPAVPAATSWILDVEMVRAHGRSGGGAPRAFAPRFPKLKDEGWWLVVGDPGAGELLALKRVSFGRRGTARLAISCCGAPGVELGGIAASLEVRLVSDCYLGLDVTQQVQVPQNRSDWGFTMPHTI
jgi:activating signal cointegrator complex subunit 3